MNYALKEIKKNYSFIKKLAFKCIRNGDYTNALIHFDNAATLAYNVNWIFFDKEIENGIEQISAKLFDFSRQDELTLNNNKFIYYDNIGNAAVLTLQYLRALMSWDLSFLYILDPSKYTEKEEILEELKSYNKAEIYILPERMDMKLQIISDIYDKIKNYNAGKAFIHTSADGAFGVLLWTLFPQIKKYRIVPGDHHFYLGVNITDYAIEFREFGIYTSIFKRGLKKEQIILQPYYPVYRKFNFSGLPQSLIEGNKILIFSGGATYKILDKNNTYLKLIKGILDRYSNVNFAYVGNDINNVFSNFIKSNGYEERFFVLGFRKDFIEIMLRSDIYMGTFPFIGGLMCQYAALLKKPILQYFPNDNSDGIESVLSVKGAKISCRSIDEFNNYTHKLLTNRDFRIEEGNRNFELIITPETFNENLYKQVFEKKNEIKIMHITQLYFEEKVDWYLNIANTYSNYFEDFFINLYGLRKPTLTKYYFRKCYKKIKNFFFG